MIFSHNPVGQEEKQGKARFPLAVLSLFFRLLCIRRTPSPTVRQKGTFASYKGDGESRAKHKERTYSTNKKNTHAKTTQQAASRQD